MFTYHLIVCLITGHECFAFNIMLFFDVLTHAYCMYFIHDLDFIFCLMYNVMLVYIIIIIKGIMFLFNEAMEVSEKTNTHYLTLLQSVEEVLFQIDLNFRIIYINKPFRGDKENYLGKKIDEFEFFEIHQIKRLILEQPSKWTWKDTKSNNIYQFKGTLLKSFGQIDGVMISCFDITDQILSKENEIKKTKAETTLQSKIEFIASISHEIRNPLQAINYSCDNLLTKELKEDEKEYVLDIQSLNKLVATIIDDILDISKIESGKMNIEISRMNVMETCEFSLDLNYNDARNKGLNLYLTFDENVPLFINSDKKRVIQILNNLITNAIKYSIKGDIFVHCLVEKRDYLKFCVEDQGIGISKEDLKRIFIPFEQFYSGSKGWVCYWFY